MSIQLHFSPQPTRAARARWAFLEAGVAFDGHSVDVFAGEQKAPEYLAVHPLGVVPAARFDGQTVIESSALALIAAEGTALMPEAGTAEHRAVLQWVVFAPAELDHRLAALNEERLFLPPEQRNPQRRDRMMAELEERLALVAEQVGAGYLVGDDLTVADICVGHSIVWAAMHGLVETHPELVGYLERLGERPSFRELYGTRIEVMPDPHAG